MYSDHELSEAATGVDTAADDDYDSQREVPHRYLAIGPDILNK